MCAAEKKQSLNEPVLQAFFQFLYYNDFGMTEIQVGKCLQYQRMKLRNILSRHASL
jgi:hypothetical protein